MVSELLVKVTPRPKAESSLQVSFERLEDSLPDRRAVQLGGGAVDPGRGVVEEDGAFSADEAFSRRPSKPKPKTGSK